MTAPKALRSACLSPIPLSRPETCGASRAGTVKDGHPARLSRRMATAVGGLSLTVPSTALRWLEGRAIGQHPMHDDGELASECDLGLVHAGPLGDPHRPALQGGASSDRLGEDDVGGLVEHRAHRAIADLGDAAGAVGFPRLIS